MSAKSRSDRVKLATAFPTSTFLKRGLNPTQDPEQVAVNREIEHLRARYFYLETRYRGLVAAFQMLRPLLENETLRKRLQKEGKQKATSLIAHALFEACVLDCYTILIDNEETNPSLCTLARPFLKSNRIKNPRLSDQLAHIYSDRPPYWPDALKVDMFSPKDRAAWTAKNKKADDGRRLAFGRIMDRLTRDWAALAKASKRFRDFRTNVAAHSILSYDEAAQRYLYPQMHKPNELCATIEEILPIITRSIASLALVLGVGSDRIKDFERMAKQDAAIFWDLKAASRD